MKRRTKWVLRAFALVIVGLAVFVHMRATQVSDVRTLSEAVVQKIAEMNRLTQVVAYPSDVNEPQLREAIRLGLTQDATLGVLGLSQAELGGFIKVGRLQPTNVSIVNLRQLGRSHWDSRSTILSISLVVVNYSSDASAYFAPQRIRLEQDNCCK